MNSNTGELVADLVRVSRDGAAFIVKTDNGFVRGYTTNSETETADKLTDLTAGGSWRRVTRKDISAYEGHAVVAAGGVHVPAPEAPERLYRVPPTVKRAILDALESYSSLLSESDREIATRLATRTAVSRADIEWMHKFYTNVERAFQLHGGKRGQTWAAKIVSSDDEAVIAAFVPEDDVVYIAGGDNPDSTEVDALYMTEVDPQDSEEDYYYEWRDGEFVVAGNVDELDRPMLIELDEGTAAELAAWLDGGSDGGVMELQNVFPLERNLFELAAAEIDWEHIDRLSAVIADATGYSGPERSRNAQRQERQVEGKFTGGQKESDNKLTAYAKAHLSGETPLLEDVAGRIAEYIAAHPVGEDDSVPVVAAGVEDSGMTPLYLAIVDDTDKTAVLDLVAIIPDSAGEPSTWVRRSGEWQLDEELGADLVGDTPPPVVELDDVDMIKQILQQVDEHDAGGTGAEDQGDSSLVSSLNELAPNTRAGREQAAKKGYALPDGSFPIANVSDLKNAIQASGRAKDPAAAKKHIMKRARALNRADLIPEEWKSASIFNDDHLSPLYGPYGEIIASVTAAGVPGVADTPSDKASVERLYRYWTAGEGAAKIRWGTEGDLTRCHRHLAKYVGPDRAWGLCQNYHKRIFGVSNAKRDKAVGQ